ncbi:MAG: hypothetical protein AB7H92_07395 [Microbacteriaceae bacterium]
MSTHVMMEGSVIVSGANNWMMLYNGTSDAPVGHVSLWRVDLSEHGPGRALFWRTSLTGGVPEVFADNAPMAAWLAGEVLAADSPYRDGCIAVHSAQFATANRLPHGYTETIETAAGRITLAWEELGTPVYGYATPGPDDVSSHSACYVPANRVTVALGDVQAAGSAMPEDWFGTPASSCFLALSETWITQRRS